VAIDVETANPDMGSICQIGVASFVDGALADEWSTLIDPEDYFDDINVSMHGIEPGMVRGKPTFPQISDHLCSLLANTVSVCHTPFDRVALERAHARYGLPPFSTSWLDTSRVARRAWKDCAYSGYGLASVCDRIGYQFKHHDALEDAKAAGHILLAAIHESQQDLQFWQQRAEHPINLESISIHRDGNPDGDLFGEVLVFTGALTLRRSEAADLAASVGCQVDSGVTKKTTILVVGDQDVRKLNGHEKSAKHRKAEQLITQGAAIRILRESDFRAVVVSANRQAAS
jgi:DNA polymerase-3 subunit epsilon